MEKQTVNSCLAASPSHKQTAELNRLFALRFHSQALSGSPSPAHMVDLQENKQGIFLYSICMRS